MKKYLKMTFAALSAIVLNFSCLAKVPLQRSTLPRRPHSGIRTHNNIHDRTLTPLSTREQISLLKRTILTSNVSLAEAIFTGRIGKRGQRYFRTQRERRFFVRMSSRQFEELQILSLYDLRRSVHSNRFMHKLKIFELITSKFFKVTDNKNHAYQTTASKIYNNLDIVGMGRLGALVNFIPYPNSKRELVKQLLNYAKQNNNIDAYENIFWALGCLLNDIPTSFLSIFKNKPWLQSFISEYIEQTRSDFSDMPIDFIKTVAPDLYNENFFSFLRKCIIDNADNLIDILLPRDENNLPSDVRRLHPTYLNLELEGLTLDWSCGSKLIISHIASYTDTSLDVKDVARTITSFTQEKRQEIFESIKNGNSSLHDLLLEELQCFESVGENLFSLI